MHSYEYNQLLKFLYFEGYADSYEDAENLLKEITEEEFESLLERFNADPQEVRKRAKNIRNVRTTRQKLATLAAHLPPEHPAVKQVERRGVQPKHLPTYLRKGISVAENFNIIVEYLLAEGYAETIEGAELMAENISEEWAIQILAE